MTVKQTFVWRHKHTYYVRVRWTREKTKGAERWRTLDHGLRRKVQRLCFVRRSCSSLFVQNRPVPVLYPGTTFTFDFFLHHFFPSAPASTHILPLSLYPVWTLVHINEVVRRERMHRIALSSSSGVISSFYPASPSKRWESCSRL